MSVSNADYLPGWFLEQTMVDATAEYSTYVRDVWLRPSMAARYEPGLVLRSPAFVEATGLVGGMRTSHRFAILSNHMIDMGELFADDYLRARSEFATPAGSRFLVLDVYTQARKTQIVLLHLPDDERWELFRDAASAGPSAPAVSFRTLLARVRGEIVPATRRRFDAKRGAPLLPELDDDWLTTCYNPVGFDEDGTPYPLDVPISQLLKPLGDMDFRQVAGHLVFLHGVREQLNLDETGLGSPDLPDAICWGYLDHERGLSLQVLKEARLGGSGEVETGGALDDLFIRLEAGAFLTSDCAPLLDDALITCGDMVTEIHNQHAADDERLAGVRAQRSLDPFRSSAWPDDVQAYLASEAPIKPELVWLRTERVDPSGHVMARLLNEPAQSCGTHKGDLVPLSLHDTIDGVVCLAYVGI